MQSAASARTATNAAITGFTHIDTLISGATAQGLSLIVVDGSKFTPSMVSGVTSNGYTVDLQYTNGGTFPVYTVRW